MRIINNNAKFAIEDELAKLAFIRESSDYVEREVYLSDVMEMLMKHPESVTVSDNGVLRIRLSRDHFVVGYPSIEVARRQMTVERFDSYFGVSDEDQAA